MSTAVHGHRADFPNPPLALSPEEKAAVFGHVASGYMAHEVNNE